MVSGSTYFFQIVIGIVLLAVVYGIIDEVFGLSRKEAIKKITKKYGISEEQLKEIVEEVGRKYPKDLLNNKSKSTIEKIDETICPSCNTVGSFEYDITNLSTARFIGRKDFKEEDGITRNMEVFERTRYNVYHCNQCNYKKEIEGGKSKYTPKEIAEEGYRCPKCNERETVYLKDVKQLERYASNKEVEETTSRGTKTRYIKVMKSLEEETYCCHNCDFVSLATVTRDLD